MIDNYKKPLVSVVIPTRNRWEELQKAIDSCLNQEYSPMEILVYDDASDENIADMVRNKYPSVIAYPSNVQDGQLCLRNKGFCDAKGKYIFSLDDDSHFNDNNTIAEVVALLETYPNVAIIALPYFEPSFNRTYYNYEKITNVGKFGSIYIVAHFTGCAAALRKDALLEIGRYREDYYLTCWEDDASIRLMDRGWDIITISVTPLIHLFSGIRDSVRLHFLGPRNSIFFNFIHAPLAYLIPKIISTTLGILWHGMVVREPIMKIRGLIEGYRLSVNSWEKRNPVSRKTWRKFRRLLKQPEPYGPV